MRKKQKVIKLGIIIQILIILISHCSIVKAENVEIDFYIQHGGIIAFSHQDRLKIGRYNMLRSRNKNVIYQYAEDIDQILTTKLVTKEKITDNRIAQVLRNGYPNKTIEELNCDVEEMAYIATQEAIYMMCDNKDPNKYLTPSRPEQDQIAVAKAIYAAALKENGINNTAEIGIKELTKDWKEEENYVTKSYQINMEKAPINSQLEIVGGEGIKVTNLENQEIETFSNLDTFKVQIPKNKVNQNFQLKLIATVYGQEYYFCKDSNNKEFIYVEEGQHETQNIVTIRNGQVTTIMILNKDEETKQPIQGNEFELLNEEGLVIQSDLITNENGEIQIQNLEKGNYYLKQTLAKGEYDKIGTVTFIQITGEENKITIQLYNSKTKKEENINTNKEVNVFEKNQEIIDKTVTQIDNIYTTNTYREIINEINETNWYYNKDYINTINRKNIQNNTNNDLYLNTIEERNIQENINQRITKSQMTRQDFINYIDCVSLGKQTVPKLPVTGK